MLKGADWKFKKFIPDKEDIEAQCRSLEEYVRVMEEANLRLNAGGAYCAGFNRGAAWMRDKLMPHIKQLVHQLDGKSSETSIEGKLAAILKEAEEAKCTCNGNKEEPCKACACNEAVFLLDLVISAVLNEIRDQKDEFLESSIRYFLSGVQEEPEKLLPASINK